jgi:hypothetical protein
MLVLVDRGDGCLLGVNVGALRRFTTRLRAFHLDGVLAVGASPDSSVPLALRAQVLIQPAARRDLARGAQCILAAALQQRAKSLHYVPIHRDRVRECSDEFEELVLRLLAPEPVSVLGMAQVSVLLTDGRSPLYGPANTAQDLRARVRSAIDGLTMQPGGLTMRP